MAYLSMAFGNPYGDAWSIDALLDACELLIDPGVRQISLADTVGLATPEQIEETSAAVLAAHCRNRDWRASSCAARRSRGHDSRGLRCGCRRFDAAIGGLGGCPFAQDALVGNLAHGNLVGG